MSAELGVLPALPPRTSTAESASELLRSQIARGLLLPGARLREEQVAAALQISRNTVREAFRILLHEHLVEHAPYRGVTVRQVTADDVASIYTTRRLVEPLGLDVAASEPSVRERLEVCVSAAERSAAAGEWETVGTADIEFHRGLVAACASSHLDEMFGVLLAELRLAFLRVPDLQGLHEPYVGRNRQLLELVEGGDAVEARRTFAEYMDVSERQVLSLVSR